MYDFYLSNYRVLSAFCLALMFISCQPEDANQLSEAGKTEPAPFLPLQKLSLDNLENFQNPGDNWSIQGGISADYEQELHIQVTEGTGVLVNQSPPPEGSPIQTEWEHGDLELELEFLLPRKSNSGIYLQGRYEIQLLDSWQKKEVTFGDCGGIYQRWDKEKPKGQEGFEGTPPLVNASRAPGLWQHLRIVFRAPQFDDQGQKIQNAQVEQAFLNGILIHDQVDLTGPTRGSFYDEESARGPIIIQGDHGPVAFRNIQYKLLSQRRVVIDDMQYALYTGKFDSIPNFDTLTPIRSDTVGNFNKVEDLAGMKDEFGLVFTGTLQIPVAGDYLFETEIDDGGDLYINDQLVVHNEGAPGADTKRALITLDAGPHDFKLTYYEINWRSLIRVRVEGPETEKQLLASEEHYLPYELAERQSYPLAVSEETVVLRGFVKHLGVKQTHALTIGLPENRYYAYEMDQGNVLLAWRDGFADVGEMWKGRGQSQLIKTGNAPIHLLNHSSPWAELSNPDSNWPSFRSSDFRFIGYELDAEGVPVFEHQYKSIVVKDQIQTNQENMLERRIQLNPLPSEPLYYSLAAADQIETLTDNRFRIAGQYYIQTASDLPVRVRSTTSGQDLVVDLSELENKMMEYAIVW